MGRTLNLLDAETVEADGWEIISSYSRAQAIEDGVLVVVETEAARIFKYPVALTLELFGRLERGNGKHADTLTGRIWDVCYMATAATARIDGSDSYYPVIVGRETLNLRCNIGPGDEGEPVVTIGFPEDF